MKGSEGSPSGLAPETDTPTPTNGVDRALLVPHLRRVLAFAVDAVVATVVPVVLVIIGSLVFPALPAPWWLVGLILVVAGLAGISGLSVWLTGGLTIGKALTGLTERRLDTSPPAADLPGLAWSLARHSVGYVVVDVLGVGVLLSLVTPRRRCLHDVVFGCEVVYLPPDAGAETSAQQRGEAFSALLQSGQERVEERYGWMTSLLRWWVRVIVVTSSLVFFLFKTSGLGAAAQVTTPAVTTTAAPSTVGPVGLAAIMVPTSAATILLVAVAVPEDHRAYSGLEVASSVTVEHPGPAAWDPSTSTLFVASGDDEVIAVDPDSGAIIASVSVPRVPSDVVAVPGTGTIWVSSRLDDVVSVIDADTLEVIDTVSVGAPTDIAHVPGDRIVYVADWFGGPVTAIDVTTRTAVQAIELPLRPGTSKYHLERMALDPVTRHLYVEVHNSHWGPSDTDYVSVVDTATGEEIAQLDADLRALALDPTSRSLFLTPGGHDPVVRVVDTENLEDVDRLTVPADPDGHGNWFAADPLTGTIGVLSKLEEQLTVIDATTRTSIDTIAFDEQPTDVEVDPGTGAWYVSAYYGDVVYLLRPR